MKFKKIIALLLVAVTALSIFSACSEPEAIDPNAPPKALKISEIYKDGIDYESFDYSLSSKKQSLYTVAEDVINIEGKDVMGMNGSLVYYLDKNTDPQTYTVYDIKTDTKVLSVPASKTRVELINNLITVRVYANNQFARVESSAVYDKKGSKLYETAGNCSATFFGSGSFFHIGNVIYKLDANGDSVRLADLPMFFDDSQQSFYELDNGYAAIKGRHISNGTCAVIYYDKAFNITAEYRIPDIYSLSSISMLSDGTALIYTATEEDFYGDTYDVIIESEKFVNGMPQIVSRKYSINYSLFNPKDKTLAEVSGLDGYLISDKVNNKLNYTNSATDFYDVYTSNILNIVTARKIENKRINDSSPVILNVDNGASIKGQLNAQVANQKDIPVPVGNYYKITTDSSTYLLNRDGSVAKALPTASLDQRKFGFYDEFTGSAYNQSFEEIKNLSGYTIYYEDSACILFFDTDENENKRYFMISDNGETQIQLGPNEEISGITSLSYQLRKGLLRMTVRNSENGEVKYRYYNYQGTLLFESNYAYRTLLGTNDFLLIYVKASVGGVTVAYYKRIK